MTIEEQTWAVEIYNKDKYVGSHYGFNFTNAMRFVEHHKYRYGPNGLKYRVVTDKRKAPRGLWTK